MIICLSIVLLVMLFTLVGGRIFLLRKKGIKAFVLAENSKSDLLLVLLMLLMLAFVYAVVASVVVFVPFPVWLRQPFAHNVFVQWGGVLLCVVGLAGFLSGLISFGNSFRVGIDEAKSGKLVTTGLFSISRNPLYLSFYLFFTGMELIHLNAAIGIVLICIFLAIHRQVLREEAFMKKHYGEEYSA